MSIEELNILLDEIYVYIVNNLDILNLTCRVHSEFYDYIYDENREYIGWHGEFISNYIKNTVEEFKK